MGYVPQESRAFDILCLSTFLKSTHKQNVKKIFLKSTLDILFMSAFLKSTHKQNVKSAFRKNFFDILFMSAFQKSLRNRMSKVLKMAGKWPGNGGNRLKLLA